MNISADMGTLKNQESRSQRLMLVRYKSKDYIQNMKNVMDTSNELHSSRAKSKEGKMVKASFYPHSHISEELQSKIWLIKAYQKLSEEKEPNQRISRPKSTISLRKNRVLIPQYQQLLVKMQLERKTKCEECGRYSCTCGKQKNRLSTPFPRRQVSKSSVENRIARKNIHVFGACIPRKTVAGYRRPTERSSLRQKVTKDFLFSFVKNN